MLLMAEMYDFRVDDFTPLSTKKAQYKATLSSQNWGFLSRRIKN